MADDTITDERIREKICQMFLESTKKSKKEYIGIEIEIPIINLNKEAVDFVLSCSASIRIRQLRKNKKWPWRKTESIMMETHFH